MNIEKALRIRGWMSEKELQWLAGIALQCKSIIEVGCYEGRSTRAMADNTTGIIYAIDPWNIPIYGNDNQTLLYRTDDITRNMFYRNLWDKIQNKTVQIIPELFHKVNQLLSYEINFIFIDAAHDYMSIKRDIEHAMCHPRLKMIAGHDYCKEWPGIIKAVDEYFPNAEKEDTIWYQKLKF